jgi:hypothetical protein
MPRRVRCRCQGSPDCKLCSGTAFYDYEPGPRGWMPFVCPTCEGKREVTPEDGERQVCFTCGGAGNVDPANPPSAPGTPGLLRNLWRIFFGG